LLANHFIETICAEMGIPIKGIESDAINELQKINYTGNIREFRNIIERLIILGQDNISVGDVKSYTKSIN
jgi:DNA-binding NtrC family response regulator